MSTLSQSHYPLSPMQLGMLYQSLSLPHSGVNVQQIVGKTEELHSEAFRCAWQKVVSHHAVLRTAFRWDGLDRPIQEVVPNAQVPFEVKDRRPPAADKFQEELDSYLQADRRQGFDLAMPPLIRVILFQCDQGGSTFVWTLHHGILDGRSFPTVLQELFTVYQGYLDGREVELPHPTPFRDFIDWHGSQNFSPSESFWRQRLAGFTNPTPLVVDSLLTRRDGEDAAYGVESLVIDEATTIRLRHFAESNGVGLSDMMQAVWAILLSRYSGEDDVVFGAVRACRRSSIPDAESIVGIFINTLPVRARIDPELSVIEFLKGLRDDQKSVQEHEHAPLIDVQRWSEVPAGTRLFQSILVFDRASLDGSLKALGGAWRNRSFEMFGQTNYPLTLYAYADDEFVLRLEYDTGRINSDAARRLLGHICTLLEGMLENPQCPVSVLPLLLRCEREQILVQWNQTNASFPQDICVHEVFESQAARTPAAPAIFFKDGQLTYRELDQKANQLAHHLRALGVGPDALVAIYVPRSLDMMLGLLGILKAGGAYLPLDPTYPKERLQFMMEDAGVAVILTQSHLRPQLPKCAAQLVCLDTEWDVIGQHPIAAPQTGVRSHHLAYVIYTSGSTGNPKGVMVEHRNVINFFTGMDDRITHSPGDTWLAVTSLSFDISVLELFWTLSRGFKVVIYVGEDRRRTGTAVTTDGHSKRAIDFSLFYFSADQSQDRNHKYRLLIEGARFADEYGFAAVWTPERHFHDFGGLYPNPAVTSAAIAMITRHVQIRSGSVVAPLHTPIRIAEEWSVVDNLSNGRVGISFASGWMPEDFVLKPENFAQRKQIMAQDVDIVRRLWRGETISFPGSLGRDIPIKILPPPVQPELPVWITAAGNSETFELAGKLGANILTHLLGQDLAEVAGKIKLYRRAWREAGHAGQGHVTLMLHTFVSGSLEFVMETVQRPLTEYLRTSADLIKHYSWAFPAFKGARKTAGQINFAELSKHDMDAVLAHAFDRYFETGGLFGTPETCLEMIEKLKTHDVDEIACLIDFGISADVVLENLKYLDALRQAAMRPEAPDVKDNSIPALIRKHAVTHFQCTPSMAGMLLLDNEAKSAVSSLTHWMIGGEAFPPMLAEELASHVRGKVINMYGPTETTVWSSTFALNGTPETIPIGRPIANTSIYVLDKNLQPVPLGLPGELMIGGAGVVRGYLNRPELTAERFIANPFNETSSDRLYRTGDLARFLPDGNIEFIGRLDHQVKIRGHRIELGEIEAALTNHPSVRESVVIAREDVPGDKRLVAYVILRAEESFDSTSLRDYLKDKLPDHMLPWHIVRVDSFLQTPNRKIDRKALPRPDRQETLTETGFEAPANGLEQSLAAMWREVVGVDRVSRHDSFFGAGGHSLLAVQLVSKIRQQFDVNLSLRTFLQQPTLSGLAKVIGMLREQPSSEPTLTESTETRKKPQAAEPTGNKGEHDRPNGAIRKHEPDGVRLMRLDDLEQVIDLHLEHFPDWRNTKLGRPFVRKMYRWFLTKHGELALVAVKDGRVAGFTVGKIGEHRRSMFLYTLAEAFWGHVRRPHLLFEKKTAEYLSSLVGAPVPNFRSNGKAMDTCGPVAENMIMAAAKTVEGVGVDLIVAFEEAARRRGTTAAFHASE